MTKHISWRWVAVIVGTAGATMAIAGLSPQESCACRPARFWLGGTYMRSLVSAQLDHYDTHGAFSDTLSDTALDAGLGEMGDFQRDGNTDRLQDYYTLSLKTTPTTAVIALTPRADAAKTITYYLLGQRIWERSVPANDFYGYVAGLVVEAPGNVSSAEPTLAEPAIVICKATRPGAIALPAPVLSENGATCSPGTQPD